MRPHERLPWLLDVLRHGRNTAAHLATRLGVCVRTVYRDIRVLRSQGFSIGGEVGPNGGFWLAADSRPLPVPLSTDDIRDVAMALIVTGSADPSLLGRLVDTLPARAAAELQGLINVTRQDDLPSSPGTSARQVLAAFSGALGRCRFLQFMDTSSGERSLRMVQAQGLVVRNSALCLSVVERWTGVCSEVDIGHILHPRTSHVHANSALSPDGVDLTFERRTRIQSLRWPPRRRVHSMA